MARSGLVDIAASQEPDGREVFNNVRYGVVVTFKAHSEYARACFKQYGLLTDPSRWYASLWRPFHLIGLEESVSVLSAVLRNEATGSSREFRRCRHCEERHAVGRNARWRGRLRGFGEVVIARWLTTGARVLMFDEPTRGVDVGAKAEIYALLRQFAAAGAAVLVISSELPQLLLLSRRIGVVNRGRLTQIPENGSHPRRVL
jgi:ABC-type histidine transport system ATPase subunit